MYSNVISALEFINYEVQNLKLDIKHSGKDYNEYEYEYDEDYYEDGGGDDRGWSSLPMLEVRNVVCKISTRFIPLLMK